MMIPLNSRHRSLLRGCRTARGPPGPARNPFLRRANPAVFAVTDRYAGFADKSSGTLTTERTVLAAFALLRIKTGDRSEKKEIVLC